MKTNTDFTHEPIDKIIEEVEAMNPYKQSGNRDSYSKYNEGWSDACDEIMGRISHTQDSEEEVAEDSTWTWHAFLNYGMKHTDNIVDGFPWSFNFFGCPVTHENNQLYLIPLPNGKVIEFTPSNTLQVCGNSVFLNETQSKEVSLGEANRIIAKEHPEINTYTQNYE